MRKTETAEQLRDLYDAAIDAGDDDRADQLAGYVLDVESGELTEGEALELLAAAEN